MNIFYLNENPKACAQLHVDKHVVKMTLEYLLSKPPKNIESRGFLMPAQAMPGQYKNSRDAVKAYKAYYKGEKSHMFKWTSRDINPEFFD